METPNQNAAAIARTGVMLLLIALCGIAGISTFYFVREHRQSQQLATSNQALIANLNQMQGQLQALLGLLDGLRGDDDLSANNRRARFYKLTPEGRKQLARELREFERVISAITKG